MSLENKVVQLKSQIEALQGKIEKERSNHPKIENLKKFYESQSKKLNKEKTELESTFKELDERYKKECLAHKETVKRKEVCYQRNDKSKFFLRVIELEFSF